jgi:hypothetical protein
MAGDERFIGKDFFASFTPQGGSAIILTEDYRNYTGERSLQEVDLTAGGDDNERFATAFRRGTFGFVVLQGNPDLDTLEEGASGSLIIGHKGNGTGKPKITMPAKLIQKNESGGYMDAMQWDLNFRRDGAEVPGAFS